MPQRLIQTLMTRLSPFLVFTLMLQLYSAVPCVHAGEDGTVEKPKTWLTPGIPIESPGPKTESKEKEKKSWLSRNKWWVALGAVVLGGAAAAAAGGGSGGEGSDGSGDGSYSLEW